MDKQNKELLNYFIEHTNERFKEVKEELKDVKTELKGLTQIRWRAAGAGAALGAVGFLAFEVCKLFFF